MFPALLDAPAYEPLRLSPGERVVGYPDPHVARLDRGEGERAVLESSIPLVATNAAGVRAPVDLGLIDRGSGFVPVNPLVEVEIPKDLRAGVRLRGSGMGLTPVDESGNALEGAAGVVEGASVFFANSQRDADMVVKPVPAGFETHTILRSPESPSELFFEIGASDGVQLLEDGSGAVRVRQDGLMVASVAAPSAWDAAGVQVPVEMRVAGKTLVLAVEHASADYLYPIQVDPTVTEEHLFGFEEGPGWWVYSTTAPEAFVGTWESRWDTLNTDDSGSYYEAGELAGWSYWTQGISRIYEFASYTEALKTEDDSRIGNLVGILSAAQRIEASTYMGDQYWVDDATVCPGGNCESGSGTGNNLAIFQQYAYGWGYYARARFYGSRLKIAQDRGPTISFNTTSDYINGTKNPLRVLGGGRTPWVRTSDAANIEITATDPGIGVYERGASSTTYSRWNGTVSYGSAGGCIGVQCDGLVGWITSVGNLPEGISTVEARAANATGASARTTAQIKVDNTAARIAVTGLSDGETISEGTRTVHVVASDGTEPTASSGLPERAVTISIDGTQVSESGVSSCSPGPCEVSRYYTLRGHEWGVGPHELVVRTRDDAGNTSERVFGFTVQRAPSVPVGPGEVELATGAYTLAATDVAESGAGAGLSVLRSYDSQRDDSAFSVFGPGWQLSLGGWQSVRELPNGDAMLIDARGQAVVFALSRGIYTPPAGYQGLSLDYDAEQDAFTLTDASANMTTFTNPGTGEYVPTSASGPNGASTTTFEVETLEEPEEEEREAEASRPTRALAPVPAGVRCETLVRGCRALTFDYATRTTATGYPSSRWGDYTGRLRSVVFHAWDSGSSQMVERTVAQYAYDLAGRLRAVWNPQITPALKTTYGYDAEGRVTAVTAPGQQPWTMAYGTVAGDTGSDWLLSVSRPAASTAAGSGTAPAPSTAPRLSTIYPRQGVALSTWNGSWDNSPVSYGYRWHRCNSSGSSCTAIIGATGQSYTPTAGDSGKTLRAQVTATNASGSATSTSAASRVLGTLSDPAYVSQFGTLGSDPGELYYPSAIDTDSAGNLWVADAGNSRIEKFSASGRFLAAYGSEGTGDGQFIWPLGLAVNQSTGDIYIADTGNERIQQFSPEGRFIRAFGTSGSRTGQLSYPLGLAIDAGGDVWVADTGNSRVQQFSSTGTYISSFGRGGWGTGAFIEPSDLAITDERVYVTDYGLYGGRVQEFSPAGAFEHQFGHSIGGGDEQLSYPLGIAAQPGTGDLYVLDTGHSRVAVFDAEGDYQGEFGTEGSGNGQFYGPWGIALGNEAIFVADSENNRVQEFGADARQEAPPPPDATTATWSVRYHVPVTGRSAPYELGAATAADWGQSQVAADATAIFPPDQVPPPQASDYRRAAIYYLDGAGHNVNLAAPGGRITAKEYDEYGNVTRTLSAANRQAALDAGEASVEVAEQLDTQLAYSTDGVDLEEVVGPLHTVELADGREVQARQRTQYTYDEGAPEGGPHHLLTTETESAQIAGQADADARTTVYDYDGQEGLGWTLRSPTSVTRDPGGLELTTTTLYDAATGNVTETRQPSNPRGGDANAAQTLYYAADEHSVRACGEHPEWANLPCQTKPAAQPGTRGLPDLPVTTITYDLYNQGAAVTETVGEDTRTVTSTYDTAGRPTRTTISSTSGTALPAITIGYDETLGLPVTQSDGTRTITSAYNTLGQITRYTDADANTSTYTYDLEGRLITINSGRGRQTYAYDTTTGDLAAIEDSAAGTFRAAYDLDGNLVTQTYPNGMDATTTYDPTGQATELAYVKTTNCRANCTWYSDQATPSIHGQWLTRQSSLSSQNYAYDATGRLTQVQDTPAGAGCTTRIYGWDQDTNRTGVTTRAPREDRGCATAGGSTETHAFDTADRLTDEGIAYDSFGNITALPAAAAGGAELASSYYADNTLASQSQNGTTIRYSLDPAGRDRLTTTRAGETTTTLTSHFAGASDSPAWTIDNAENTTRYITAFNGLAATQVNSSEPVLQLTNLHGDTIATAALSGTATELTSTEDTTEYGVPRGRTPPRHNWLGSAQRPTELPTGIINMGARGYIPQLGQFQQTDPIAGGSATAYSYTHGDPVNQSDLTGAATPSAPDWLLGFLQANPPNIPAPTPAIAPPAVTSVNVGIGSGSGANASRRARVSPAEFGIGPCTFHGRAYTDSRSNMALIQYFIYFRCDRIVSVGGWAYAKTYLGTAATGHFYLKNVYAGHLPVLSLTLPFGIGGRIPGICIEIIDNGRRRNGCWTGRPI